MLSGKATTKPGIFRSLDGSDVCENSDLTPKPLRIAKRSSLRYSDPEAVSTLPSIPTSQTSSSVGSSRQDSVSTDHSLVDLSQDSSRKPSLEYNYRYSHRYVRKKCGREPKYVSPVKSNVGPDRSDVTQLPRSHSMATSRSRPLIVDTCLENISIDIKSRAPSSPGSKRVFTTGCLAKECFHSPINDKEPPIPLAPNPVIVSRPRAITIDETVHQSAAQRQSDRSLRKQPSFKNRLMNRVMSGLSIKSPTIHEEIQNGTYFLQESNSMTPLPSSPTEDNLESVRHSSTSTIGTESCKGSELEIALAAFPTPPTSINTSPTTNRTTQHSSMDSQRLRNLRKPEDGNYMGVDLTITPEHDQLTSDNGKTLYVAIDMQGVLNTTVNGQNLWSQNTGLDVAIIVDNSTDASPSTLMGSCEVARFVAANLNAATDRAAILCTSSDDHWPLSCIRIHRLKRFLDTVASSTKASNWTNSVTSATEILLRSGVPDPEMEAHQDTFGHVFILTASAANLDSSLLTHPKIQYHLICPAIMPSKDYFSVICNGWKLSSLSENETLLVNARKDKGSASLFNRIKGLIGHARGGKTLSRLTDIVLDIKPGPNCSIEDVIGRSEYSMLHPGELCTVLVKVKMHASDAEGYTLPPNASYIEKSAELDDILGELDKMLGVTLVRILSARVKYKHPLLPQGTTCAVSANCRLKKQVIIPQQGSSPRKVSTTERKDCTVLVQKRLAFHLATCGSPQKALLSVRRTFGENGIISLCPSYICSLIQALRYQIRLVERREISTASSESAEHIPNKTPSKSPDENFKSDGWIMNAIDEGVSNSEEVQLAILSDLKANKSRNPTDEDEALTIWGDTIKNSTRGPSFAARERAVSSKMNEPRTQGVKALALKHKRSLGSGTLRNITHTGESMAKGLGVSWL